MHEPGAEGATSPALPTCGAPCDGGTADAFHVTTRRVLLANGCRRCSARLVAAVHPRTAARADVLLGLSREVDSDQVAVELRRRYRAGSVIAVGVARW